MTRAELRKAIEQGHFPIRFSTDNVQIEVKNSKAIWQAPAPDDDTVVIHMPKFGVLIYRLD
jgi:hypothetical protein